MKKEVYNSNGSFRFLIAALLVVSFLFAGSATTFAGGEKYSKVRIFSSGSRDMMKLNKAGLVVDHAQPVSGGFDVVLNAAEMGWLKNANVRFKVIVDDLSADYEKNNSMSRSKLNALEGQMRQLYPVPARFEFGSMGGYYTLDEIVDQLDEMFANYPGLVAEKQSIGTSIEGRPIWMVKISDNPGVDEPEEEILYTALMHVREAITQANLIYYMFYVLENYGVDPTITYLLENRELYFIPCLNPDGYVYNQQTNPNGGGFWRKNRRNNGDGSFGVDLNRNFDFKWGYNNSGSSPNTNGSTYRGTSPASEPETAALQNFAISREFTMAFNHHSVAGSYNFSWGYLSSNSETPDQIQYETFSKNFSLFNDYRYGTPWQNLRYTTNGYSNDWFYGEQTLKGKTFAWTVENGGSGFWPSQSQIIPLCQDHLYSNLALAWGVNGGPSAADVSMAATNPPVSIPKSGGSFDFDINIANNSGAPIDIRYYTYGQRSTGGITDPLKGPFNATIEPGNAVNVTLTQNVPPLDPASFTYILQVESSSNNRLIANDSFPFVVTNAPSTGQLKAGGETWTFSDDTEHGSPLPESVELLGNYPNPFNPETRISYRLSEARHVTLQVFDIKGRLISELVNGEQAAGPQNIFWNGKTSEGKRVASGIYLYRLVAGDFSQTNKMLLVK